MMDYISFALKNISRNKKNYILIIVTGLLFILLIVDCIFLKNFNGYMDYAINHNVAFRTFTIDKPNTTFEEGKNELRNINSIAEVYEANFYYFAVETDLNFNGLDGWIGLEYGSENISPTSVVGKSMKEVHPGEMVCPYLFYPDVDADEFNLDETKIIRLEQILNYEFNVYYNVYDLVNGELERRPEKESKKFKIVGLYDNKLVMNPNNQCYITMQDMKELKFNNNRYQFENQSNDFFAHIVVDNVKSINKVKKEIQELGYFVHNDEIASFDKMTVNIVHIIAISIFIVLFLTVFLILINYLKKKVKLEANNMGTLRSCGYTKEQIIKTQLVEILLIMSISYLIGLIIFSLFFSLYVKNLFNFISYSGFYLSNSLLVLVLLYVSMLVFVRFVTLKIVSKRLDIPISKLLNEK